MLGDSHRTEEASPFAERWSVVGSRLLRSVPHYVAYTRRDAKFFFLLKPRLLPLLRELTRLDPIIVPCRLVAEFLPPCLRDPGRCGLFVLRRRMLVDWAIERGGNGAIVVSCFHPEEVSTNHRLSSAHAR